MNEKEITRAEALELLLDWMIECDFGLDNIVDRDAPYYKEWLDKSDDIGYKASIVLYAKLHLLYQKEKRKRRGLTVKELKERLTQLEKQGYGDNEVSQVIKNGVLIGLYMG